MSNICKTVSLRTRKIKDGHMLSYYLDYYPGYRDESTMKVIRHESLGIYIYANRRTRRNRSTTSTLRQEPRRYAAVASRLSSTSVMISSTRRR